MREMHQPSLWEYGAIIAASRNGLISLKQGDHWSLYSVGRFSSLQAVALLDEPYYFIRRSRCAKEGLHLDVISFSLPFHDLF